MKRQKWHKLKALECQELGATKVARPDHKERCIFVIEPIDSNQAHSKTCMQ